MSRWSGRPGEAAHASPTGMPEPAGDTDGGGDAEPRCTHVHPLSLPGLGEGAGARLGGVDRGSSPVV